LYPEFVLEKFLADAPLCKNVDCLLVKLSTAVYALEDFLKESPFMQKSSAELIKEFLYDERVQRVLASLANYADTISMMVQNDPRFKNLRGYLDLLLEAVATASQRYQSIIYLEHVERAPTWRVEQEKEMLSGYTWKLQTRSIETLSETETSRDETSIPVKIVKKVKSGEDGQLIQGR
jgi:hypothetical protein